MPKSTSLPETPPGVHAPAADARRLPGRLDYTTRRYYVDDFYFRHASILPPGARVLDLGGTRTRKRGEFRIEGYPVKVAYLNISLAKAPDILGDAGRLPFASSSFDAVICSEVLEHVYDPPVVLREVYRALRPGGFLLACVPFIYRIHGDPDDYGRYTDHYWRQVLRDQGFSEVTVERQGLFYSVVVDCAKQYVNHSGIRRPLRTLAAWLLGRAESWAISRERQLDARQNQFLSSFTTGFGISALRP